MPVTKPYRKQLTDRPLPQITAQSAGNFLRQSAQQQRNLAQQSYKKSMEIYDNTMDIMIQQEVKNAYDANKNNPTGFDDRIKQIMPELLKPIKNPAKKQEFALKLQIHAEPFKDKALKLFNTQQAEQLTTSIFSKFNETKLNTEDTSELLFGDPNSQATLKYGLSYWTGFDALTTMLNQKDEEGNLLLTPSQITGKIRQYESDVLSAGARGYFDNASIQDKYKFYQQYKGKEATILIPDAKSKTGFSSQSVDKFIDRTQYEQDVKYMDKWINKFETKTKKNKSKQKEAAELSLLETRAALQIETALSQFQIEKGKVTEKDNFIDMANYTNMVYDAQAKGLISQEEAEGFLKPINNSFDEIVNEIKISGEHKEGYWNPLKEDKLSAWGQGITDLNSYIDQLGQSENKNLKRDLYMAYYNGLQDAQVDIKSFTKDDLQKSAQVLENTKRKFAETQYPELATFRQQTINAALGDKGLLPITPKQPQKPAKLKATMPGYTLAKDAQGNTAWVKRDKAGNIIDFTEVK